VARKGRGARRGTDPVYAAEHDALPRVVALKGGHTAIVFAGGRKWLHAVAMDQPIGIVTLPIANDFDTLELKGKPYPVRRAARIYLRSPIVKTERAKRVLRALAKGTTEVLA